MLSSSPRFWGNGLAQHPDHYTGVTSVNMNGTKDAYYVEGSDLSIYDSSKQSWVIQGDLIELSGKSPLCPWDVTTSTCK